MRLITQPIELFLWWLGHNGRSRIDCGGDLGTVYGTRNDPPNIQLSLGLCSNWPITQSDSVVHMPSAFLPLHSQSAEQRRRKMAGVRRRFGRDALLAVKQINRANVKQLELVWS